VNNLIARIPAKTRDTDGVRLDEALTEAGITVLREQPRMTRGETAWVDLLVEHTSAPEDIRGQVVVPVCDELEDGRLSFDRWELWTPTDPAAEVGKE